MKKRSHIIPFLVLPALFSLSACKNPFKKDEEIIVTDATIDVVSSLKINLTKQTTKKLYPKLSVTSVKDPVFLYESSNNSVATVSSDGTVTGVSEGEAKVTITLKINTSIKKEVNVRVVNESVDALDYTLMFYMCGSTLEYNKPTTPDNDHQFFTKDIEEMLSVSGMPDSVKIIIQTGGTKHWFMDSSKLEGATKISATNLQRWEVNGETHKLKLIETLSTNYMAKESEFSDFLSWGLDDYEASQMGVVISGHGGGIAGCAYDDNYTYKYGDNYYDYTLRTFEVANAAKVALSNSSKDKFTWIGYDCCLMQCADIASINADYFDYMVASQENELATGWDHDYYLPTLYSNPTVTPSSLLPMICDGFVADNHSDSEPVSKACLQTLSVLNLSYAETFVNAFNTMSAAIGTNKLSYLFVKERFEDSYNKFGDSMFGLCDLKSLLDELSSHSVNTSAVEDAIAVGHLVLYKKNCSKYSTIPCGINAFFPEYLGERGYDLQVGTEDYNNPLATKLTSWQTMCVNNGTFGW